MSALRTQVTEIVTRIRTQIPMRMPRVAVEIKNGATNVMHGGPSKPGEPPGVRSETYRKSFNPQAVGFTARATSNVIYGPYLERGTHKKDGSQKMAPRPHCERILQDALPRAIMILSEPYI